MSTLGIYFGPQAIRIVETKGRLPVNNIRIPMKVISSQGPFQEKVPEEVKLITAIKDELRKNKVQSADTVISLSGKDLIIRIFDMPVMPQQELANAANFEVKKYIPFKVEDMIYDYQFKLDRPSRKNHVLFMGIKKEILDKYLSILKQSGLKVKAIEYSGFSILRLFPLSGTGNKDVIAQVNIDLKEEDEVNFMVLESGFPLFSRDIPFVSETSPFVERLKSEIRVSLTYYDRTFPHKNISKVFFLIDNDHRADLESFMKEVGLNSQFLNFSKCIGRQAPYSLEFIKAYCSSLSKIATAVKIDLLAAKEKTIKTVGSQALTPALLVKRFMLELIVGGISLFVLISVFLSGMVRLTPLEQEIRSIKETRSAVPGVPAEASFEELDSMSSDYKTKIKAMDDLVRGQVLFTELLDAIPRILPKEARLTEISLGKDAHKTELILSGTASLGESSRELELVNSFLSSLKENAAFSKYFNNISIASIDRGQGQDKAVTNFKISCKNYK